MRESDERDDKYPEKSIPLTLVLLSPAVALKGVSVDSHCGGCRSPLPPNTLEAAK